MRYTKFVFQVKSHPCFGLSNSRRTDMELKIRRKGFFLNPRLLLTKLVLNSSKYDILSLYFIISGEKVMFQHSNG